jgi:hypothetical protein
LTGSLPSKCKTLSSKPQYHPPPTHKKIDFEWLFFEPACYNKLLIPKERDIALFIFDFPVSIQYQTQSINAVNDNEMSHKFGK